MKQLKIKDKNTRVKDEYDINEDVDHTANYLWTWEDGFHHGNFVDKILNKYDYDKSKVTKTEAKSLLDEFYAKLQAKVSDILTKGYDIQLSKINSRNIPDSKKKIKDSNASILFSKISDKIDELLQLTGQLIEETKISENDEQLDLAMQLDDMLCDLENFCTMGCSRPFGDSKKDAKVKDTKYVVQFPESGEYYNKNDDTGTYATDFISEATTFNSIEEIYSQLDEIIDAAYSEDDKYRYFNENANVAEFVKFVEINDSKPKKDAKVKDIDTSSLKDLWKEIRERFNVKGKLIEEYDCIETYNVYGNDELDKQITDFIKSKGYNVEFDGIDDAGCYTITDSKKSKKVKDSTLYLEAPEKDENGIFGVDTLVSIARKYGLYIAKSDTVEFGPNKGYAEMQIDGPREKIEQMLNDLGWKDYIEFIEDAKTTKDKKVKDYGTPQESMNHFSSATDELEELRSRMSNEDAVRQYFRNHAYENSLRSPYEFKRELNRIRQDINHVSNDVLSPEDFLSIVKPVIETEFGITCPTEY